MLVLQEPEGASGCRPHLLPVPAGVAPDISNDTLLSSIASALHTASAPITGQTSVAAEKNPALWLNTTQPLCKAFTVTDEHIR